MCSYAARVHLNQSCKLTYLEMVPRTRGNPLTAQFPHWKAPCIPASPTPCPFTTRHRCLPVSGAPNASPDPFPEQRLHNMREQIKYWPEAVTCCRTLYSHPGGAVTVKNTLFAVKHGFAYALRCAPRRPWRSYIKRRPCRWLYWEGKQRVESAGIIFFWGRFFNTAPKAFLLGFWGWLRRSEQAIKLMNGRLMDFIARLRRKTKDAHQVFFFFSMSQELWKLLLTDGGWCLNIIWVNLIVVIAEYLF